MRRRKRQAPAGGPPTREFHHQPFKHLPAAAPVPAVPPPPSPPAPALAPALATDADVFAREMRDVRPLSAAARTRVAPPPPMAVRRAITDPDAEALAELWDLLAGGGRFDLANSVESVEGGVVGLDNRILRRLRAGEFAYQSHLDLHGMSSDEARVAVDRFLSHASRQGQRCVLIIHGRGRNSKDQIPVLKLRLTNWLARGAWSRLVLAFTSARACDGGTGALYVLLRRRREGKRPMRVTHGANW
ncbi:MAG: Smr/MutS family protein [Candidatus Binatia bacterium]